MHISTTGHLNCHYSQTPLIYETGRTDNGKLDGKKNGANKKGNGTGKERTVATSKPRPKRTSQIRQIFFVEYIQTLVTQN